MNDTPAITLLELTRRIGAAITVAPGLQNVWVTAETSDVRTSGGHCYMELLQKDPATGMPQSRCRAVIWASNYYRLAAQFQASTGSRLQSDMKIMVRVNTSFHAVYGLSLVITDINPDYTLGDLARRRNEILNRLRAEGVADMNRTLSWPVRPWRVAIVSAPGAAGYGDFMRHLHDNAAHFRFHTELFEATMQGERTAASVIAALDAIAGRDGEFDCVVIIRGGGSVSDLASFDDYNLAANVAQFPLPVIVGIGHERDITVLDYIANIRVKTPTAAAEALIGKISATYDRVRQLGDEILRTVTDRIGGQRQQLAYIQGTLPALVRNALARCRRHIDAEIAPAIAATAQNTIMAQRQRLANTATLAATLAGGHIAASRRRIEAETIPALKTALQGTTTRARQRLEADATLLEALSPEATLRRGYSITRVGGRAVTDSALLTPGTVLTTTFATGKPVESTVK